VYSHVSVPASVKKRNRKLIAARNDGIEECRRMSGGDRKLGCYRHCPRGRDVCPYSIRELSFRNGFCIKCKQTALMDPQRSCEICIHCLHKGN